MYIILKWIPLAGKLFFSAVKNNENGAPGDETLILRQNSFTWNVNKPHRNRIEGIIIIMSPKHVQWPTYPHQGDRLYY